LALTASIVRMYPGAMRQASCYGFPYAAFAVRTGLRDMWSSLTVLPSWDRYSRETLWASPAPWLSATRYSGHYEGDTAYSSSSTPALDTRGSRTDLKQCR
jgi:hypothetical protein